MRQLLARSVLRASGLPSLGHVIPDAVTAARFEDVATALLDGGESPPRDVRLPEFLRWLAVHRPVLFHGSSRSDLDLLEPIRLSRDSRQFGDRRAVFAASDPIWALYFATVQRGSRFSTRNGSLGLAGSLYPRWYFFSHGEWMDEGFADGWLYVLPRATFSPETPELGVLDTGQWASPEAVRPLARIQVTPADFPFTQLVVRHRDNDSILKTMWRAGRAAQRERLSSRPTAGTPGPRR